VHNPHSADPGKPRIPALVGATAVGKSALALRLAAYFDSKGGAEIVSADSRQLYKGLSIGTGKPTPAELAKVPHHFIDIATPDQPYNAARFATEARAVILDILQRGKLPIVVGGTGLYVQALEQGFDAMPDVEDAIRTGLNQEHATQGLAPLVAELQQADPATAAVIDLRNPARVKRALEVIRATGLPFSSFKKGGSISNDLPFGLLHIGLELPRAELYATIDLRVLQMLAAGLVSEVESLLTAGYSPTLPSMQTIGYSEVIAYLQEQWAYDTMVQKLQQHTRNYAKRQLTWFRRTPGIQWFHPTNDAAIIDYIDHWLKR